jgi:hypothetical protein
MLPSYDPHEAPDPEEWQMLDEAERSVLVQAYHEEAGIEMPNVIVHSAIHTTVENQAHWEMSSRSEASSTI